MNRTKITQVLRNSLLTGAMLIPLCAYGAGGNQTQTTSTSYDVSGDGKINILDIAKLISCLNDKQAHPIIYKYTGTIYDYDNDGDMTIKDVNILRDYILKYQLQITDKPGNPDTPVLAPPVKDPPSAVR